MKTGRTLQELAIEIDRQSKTRRDFIAPNSKIEMLSSATELVGLGDGETFGINDLGHEQFGEYIDVPRKYYERIKKEQPALLATTVNTLLHAKDESRKLRTLDGKVRAVVSPRFRALDNYDLMDAILPVLLDQKAEIVSCEVTPYRLYLKATLGSLAREVVGSHEVGDIMQMMLTISNSEVGAGALRVEPGAYRVVCKNGLTALAALKRYHVGKMAELEDNVREVLTDQTKRLDDAAFWSKTRDVVKAAFDPRIFEAEVARFSEATQQRIASTSVQEVIDVTVRTLGLPEKLGGGILTHLIEGGDLSRWGLANAITRTASDVEDYELATQMERAGGKVIELSKKDWIAISEAA